MSRELFLPGHPLNTPENVRIWGTIQYSTWLELLEGTRQFRNGEVSLSGISITRRFSVGKDGKDRYEIERVADPKSPFSLRIDRSSGSILVARLTYRIGSASAMATEDHPMQVYHAEFGSHDSTPTAVAIGRLEQVRFQQGEAAYNRNTRWIQ